MLTQSELERERYESRRKAQLDHNTYMKEAQMEREEARMEGLTRVRRSARFSFASVCSIGRRRPPNNWLNGRWTN